MIVITEGKQVSSQDSILLMFTRINSNENKIEKNRISPTTEVTDVAQCSLLEIFMICEIRRTVRHVIYLSIL